MTFFFENEWHVALFLWGKVHARSVLVDSSVERLLAAVIKETLCLRRCRAMMRCSRVCETSVLAVCCPFSLRGKLSLVVAGHAFDVCG